MNKIRRKESYSSRGRLSKRQKYKKQINSKDNKLEFRGKKKNVKSDRREIGEKNKKKIESKDKSSSFRKRNKKNA